MHISLRKWPGVLALIAGSQAGMAQAESLCWVRPSTGTISYQVNVGALYVPRDAAVGSVIGAFDQAFSKGSNEGRYVYCNNDGTSTLTFNARAVAPIVSTPLPPVNGEDVTGKVFETGIAGIGAIIKLKHPFDGVAPDAFVPVTGAPTVPFNALLRAAIPAPLNILSLEGTVTLIKTGPIAPGPQAVDRLLFDSRFSAISGSVFTVQLVGTVLQAQCNVSVVSDNPVNLGDWRASDFSGAGNGTTPVSFNIRLGNCEADPGNNNVAWANIRLDGVSGSAPIPGVEGAFSLTLDSSAAGVAIQVLRGDGSTPVALGRDVPLVAVSPGITVLDLSARYYQIGDARDIVPGQAKGALSFTVSFQ